MTAPTLNTPIDVIHKHVLTPFDCFVPLAPGAQVLAVGVQDGQIVMWERHRTPADSLVGRHFTLVWTGGEVRGGEYVGTVTTSDALVWHIFEVPA